jgi:hypothetical protein
MSSEATDAMDTENLITFETPKHGYPPLTGNEGTEENPPTFAQGGKRTPTATNKNTGGHADTTVKPQTPTQPKDKPELT